MKKLFTFILALVAGVGTIFATQGALSGKFTINADGDQVVFSQGNLQYVGTWQFATNQWDYFGESQSDNHRDLFGFGTGDNPNNVSTDYHDYATYTEWGNNPITNGGNKANQWRTLTRDEWVYLFHGRTNAATLFGLGSVNGLNGTILLPDNWTLPSGLSFTASTSTGLVWTDDSYYYDSNGGHFGDNTYTTEQWATMEAAGAVFLPAAGYRLGADVYVYDVGSDGGYWSSTPYDENYAYYLYFYSNSLNPQNGNDRYNGLSVRLVQDIIPEPEINYSLRLCGQYVTDKNCSDIASYISGITKVDPEAPSQLAYDEETNTLTMQNVKLTTSDVTWAVFNQIDGLTIEVLDTCVLHAPYCIALRTDKNLTIRGANSNAYLKVLNDGPLDHQVGSTPAGMGYTALATFSNANLTIEDCTVQAEGAGGIKAQESSLVTLKNVHLTAKVIGTPTSDNQLKQMYSFLANVEPVLIDCEPISPEGLEFSSTLGGYAVNGELTRDEIEINTVPESDVAYVCDFTKQANGHSYYSDEWTYDNDWLIFGGANNNAAWNYCKFGGKQATLTTANPVYIKSAQPLQKDITKIKVYIHEGSLAKEGMSINEWGITTLNQDGSVDETYTISNSIITNISLIFIFVVSDNLAPHFSAGHYFQIYWDLANTTTTNGMIWIDKVEFLSEKENPTTGIEERNTDMQSATVKFIRNGQLFIRRGEEIFNAQGARVK